MIFCEQTAEPGHRMMAWDEELLKSTKKEEVVESYCFFLPEDKWYIKEI